MRRLAGMMERHPIRTAMAAGVGLALFLFYGEVWMAAVIEPVALIAIWRGNL